MEKIKVIVDGERVWEPMIKAAEIALALKDDRPVCVDLNGESPSIDNTPLPQFFRYLESNNIDISKITVLTGNPLEQYQGVKIEHDELAFYEIRMFQNHLDQIPTHKNIQYHFGNLISKTSLPRLVIASHLFANYKEKTLQTFHYNHVSDYHKTHLDFDNFLHHYGPNSREFDEAILLLKSSPILREPMKTYPILQVNDEIENVLVPCRWYPEIFVDVICETWYQGTNFYITEKFWRAVATKTPFIIQGPQNVLSNLKKLGFRTFDKFWDEGYQEDYSFYNIYEIKKVIKTISELSLEQINQMYHDMKDILDHNYEILQDISCHDIKNVRKIDHE